MKLIVASDPNGGIGYKNKLPWEIINGDLPRFKKLTNNSTIVMGRHTWESLPYKPLPNRKNVVVTSKGLIDARDPGAYVVAHPKVETIDSIEKAELGSWIIGGAALIQSAWPMINEVHLTTTHKNYTCDTFIDFSYLKSKFSIIYSEQHSDHVYQIWSRNGTVPDAIN